MKNSFDPRWLAQLSKALNRARNQIHPTILKRIEIYLNKALRTGDDSGLRDYLRATRVDDILQRYQTQEMFYSSTVPFEMATDTDRGSILLGYTDLEDPVTLTPEEIGQHLEISGRSGVGKTTLVLNLLAQIIDRDLAANQ